MRTAALFATVKLTVLQGVFVVLRVASATATPQSCTHGAGADEPAGRKDCIGPRISAKILFTMAMFWVVGTDCVTSTPAEQPASRSPVTVRSLAS